MRKLMLGIAVLATSLAASTAWAETSKAYEGRRLFNGYCYLCHGLDGNGNGPLARKLTIKPRNLTGDTTKEKSDRDLFRIIQGSAPHGLSNLMPKWGASISETDIKALVSYIRFMQRSAYPLVGDPELGRSVYDRYCVVCHGEGGKGNGMMTHMLPIKPADHTDSGTMGTMNNEQLLNVIANGTSGMTSYMPAWNGILTKEEMEGVVSFIRLLSYK